MSLSFIARSTILATFVGAVSSAAADNAADYYEATFTISGFLLRSAGVCGAEFKRTIRDAIALVSSPEIKTMWNGFPETTEKWMTTGAYNFNHEVMTDGATAACAHAMKIRAQVEPRIRSRR